MAWDVVAGHQETRVMGMAAPWDAFQARMDDQASRTAGIRHGVYRRAELGRARTILDVGCGTGAVSADLAAWTGARLVAVDASFAMARRAACRLASAPVAVADGACLPFADGGFDAAVCNLMLMWAARPARVVAEMARVVRPGGVVLAVMEPDYGGKVHHPENPLIDLVFRGEGIRRRGGDPHMGRKLRALLEAAGLQTDVGIGNPDVLTPAQDLDNWHRNRRFYRRLLAEGGCSATSLDAWERQYTQALSEGTQLSWFPFFWGLGRKRALGDADRS